MSSNSGISLPTSGDQDIDNNLPQASVLYKKMIEFREGQGYGPADNDLCPGRVAGS